MRGIIILANNVRYLTNRKEPSPKGVRANTENLLRIMQLPFNV